MFARAPMWHSSAQWETCRAAHRRAHQSRANGEFRRARLFAQMTHAPHALARPRRWAVLGVYAVIVGVSQMLWLNFAPLLSLVQTRYGVSELTASMLLLVFPLLYVVLS